MDPKSFGQFIPLIVIFVIFYFLLIRPQQKRIKDHKAMLSALSRGDTIVTGGGLIGKVIKVYDEDKLDVELSDNVVVKVVKSSISQVVGKTEPKK
jgi:preprotein translocase subunit YajC